MMNCKNLCSFTTLFLLQQKYRLRNNMSMIYYDVGLTPFTIPFYVKFEPVCSFASDPSTS